jgi:co-chaperonin GroES (HSP10)
MTSIASIVERLPTRNTSGIKPTEYNVLVFPKPVETITAGGIHLPLPQIEKEEFAITRGTIIECSPHAFSYRTDEEWGDTPKPTAGTHVLFEKHAGTRVPGKDGKEYVLLNDRQISATLEE